MNREQIVERKKWIDILKGVLILFVVLGHTTTNSVILNWLSSFYMPCFFILSGWLMKKDDRAKLVICKKAKAILFPYFCFALLWVLFCFAKNLIVINSDFNIFRALLSIILPYSGSPGGNAYNLWFLPCLFLSQALISIFIYEKFLYKVLIGIMWLAYIVLGVCFTPYFSLLYATAIASVFVWLGFYISNYFLPKVKEKYSKLLAVVTLLGGVLHIACFIVNVFLLGNILDFSVGSFGNFLIYILGALGGSIFCIGITNRIKRFFMLEYIGKNSMVYYALHYEVLAVVSFLVKKFVNADYLTTISSFIFTLVITTIIVWVYNKFNIDKLFK